MIDTDMWVLKCKMVNSATTINTLSLINQKVLEFLILKDTHRRELCAYAERTGVLQLWRDCVLKSPLHCPFDTMSQSNTIQLELLGFRKWNIFL